MRLLVTDYHLHFGRGSRRWSLVAGLKVECPPALGRLVLTIARKNVRVTVMALKSETITPIARVSAKPLMIDAPPNVEPNQKRIAHVMSVEAFESRMEGQAWSNPPPQPHPASCPNATPLSGEQISSTLASTAIPMDRMKPAIPASVSVTGTSLNAA